MKKGLLYWDVSISINLTAGVHRAAVFKTEVTVIYCYFSLKVPEWFLLIAWASDQISWDSSMNLLQFFFLIPLDSWLFSSFVLESRRLGFSHHYFYPFPRICSLKKICCGENQIHPLLWKLNEAKYKHSLLFSGTQLASPPELDTAKYGNKIVLEFFPPLYTVCF